MLQAPKQMKQLIEEWPSEVVVDILATLLSIGVATNDSIGKTDSAGYVEFDYEYLLGGVPHLVETYNDLKEIKILDFAAETAKDITERAGIFEVAEYLASKKFMLLYNTTSNSGGVGYYIPSKFYMSCPNILESHRLSNHFMTGKEGSVSN